MWYSSPVILRRLRKEHLKFKVSLSYTDPVSKKKVRAGDLA
jgi:hypothetical protein